MAKTGAYRCGHRLFDEVGFSRPRVQRGVVYRALLHLRHPGGNTDHHPRSRASSHLLLGLVEEVPQHQFNRIEVGDDPVPQRTDDRDVARRSTEHLPGLGAHGQRLVGGAIYGHDGRLGDYHPLLLDMHERRGGTEINRQVRREEAEHGAQHAGHDPSTPVLLPTTGWRLGKPIWHTINNLAGRINVRATGGDVLSGYRADDRRHWKPPAP